MTRTGTGPGYYRRRRKPAASPADAPAQPAAPSKYGSQFTVVDGITFRSKREARRYEKLRDRQAAGEISGLRLQPRYPLHAPNGTRVGHYVADFEYTEAGELITEDVKGMKTTLYEWKARHFLAEYGRPIKET